MSEMYFSPSRMGFFPRDLKTSYENSAGGWPEDAVQIEPEHYHALLSGQSHGLQIAVGEDGAPVLKELDGPTPEQLKSSAESKKSALLVEAAGKIAPLQYASDEGIITAEEVVSLKKWKNYCVLINRVNTASPDWPEPPEV